MSSDIAEVNIDRTAVTPEEAKALASEIIALAGSEENFDARDILRSRPELAQHRSVIVDLAYEEFCRRLDVGQPPAPREFVRRFPEVAESLLELLEVHEYLGDHPDEFVNESSPAWPEPGDEVLGFSIDHEIGRGGFSRVYLAREKDLGEREVVVKFCRQANDEAARLGKLDHPHIVPVYSVHPHPHPGFSIICMPYVGSATLGDVLAEGLAARSARRRPVADRSRLAQVLAKVRGVLNVRRRPVADRPDPATLLRKFFAAGNGPVRGADILAAIKRANERHGLPRGGRLADPRQVHWTLRRGSYTEAIVESGAEICEALAYAHAEGICHCDVKPSNVLLTASGRSLLLDFNLSRQRGVVDEAVGGTLPYMAPEQLRLVLATDAKGVSEIGPRTDLFALGVMMFQLLTGRHPFQTEEFTEGDNKEAAERLLELQGNAQNLSGELERLMSPTAAVVLAQCLAFDPNDRPPSAEQVARRLRDELRTIPRARRWVRAHKATVGGVAAALVLAITLFFALRPPLHVRKCLAGIEHLEAAAQSREELNRSDDLQSAYSEFSAVFEATGSAESAAGLACYYTQKEKWREAWNCFDQAVDQDFATPAVLYNLGYCLSKDQDKFEEAAKRLEESLVLNPKLQAAHHKLAIVSLSLAQQAVMTIEQVRAGGLKNNATNEEQRLRGFLDSAMAHIEEARKLGPQSAALERDRARIYAYASDPFRKNTTPAAGAKEEEFLEESLKSLQAAHELHLNPKELVVLVADLEILAPQLKQDDRFQQLRKRSTQTKASPVSSVAIPNVRLEDVYSDIRRRLAVLSR